MLRIEQWLAGRDFATDDATAAQMINFVYLVADDTTRTALLVDPAWDIDGLVANVAREGYTLVGALATHYHPDHIGGDLWGTQVEGIAELKERLPDVKIHAHSAEAPWIERVTGMKASDLTLHEDGDTIELGTGRITCVHTPGHSPGSTCWQATEEKSDSGTQATPASLFTGDTLFVGACGRIDLPGSDPDEMFRTLTERLAKLPADTIVQPGHDYGRTPTSTLEQERRTNPYLKVRSLEEWRRGMG